jgi:hypothetical protein
MICHSCGAERKRQGKVLRTEVCAVCDSDMHCCYNCANFNESAHNKCCEPQAEWVSDREKANFCDFFSPNSMSSKQRTGELDKARLDFANLFKGNA